MDKYLPTKVMLLNRDFILNYYEKMTCTVQQEHLSVLSRDYTSNLATGYERFTQKQWQYIDFCGSNS
jgi:hypothetical protein